MYKITLENDMVLEMMTGSRAVGLPLVLLSLFIFIVPELGYGIHGSVQSISVASLIALTGIAITIFSRKYHLVFNKKDDTFVINSQNLYKKFSKAYTISNIQKVLLNREVIYSGGSSGPRIDYQIILDMKDGSQVFLDKSGSATTRTYGLLTKNSESSTSTPIAEHIASFLGVPLSKNF